MTEEPDVREVAAALQMSIGLLRRRLRQVRPEGELTLPEIAALARLDRAGPATASALARLEQISPQSMGATLAGLEARGLVARSPDPDDGPASSCRSPAPGSRCSGTSAVPGPSSWRRHCRLASRPPSSPS